MRIAAATTEPCLDAEIAVRFGRGPFILLVDSDTLRFQVIENPDLNVRGGVSHELAQWLAAKRVQLALAAYWSPLDQQTLLSAGIQVRTVCDGSLRNTRGQARSSLMRPPEEASGIGNLAQAKKPQTTVPRNDLRP